MDISMFRHDRSTSPTVREVTPATQVKITDRGSRSPTSQRSGFASTQRRVAVLSRVTNHHLDGVVETKASGVSYTKFTWPADHANATPLHHAHARLDIRKLRTPENQAQVIQNTHAIWGGRPVLHVFEQTAATLCYKPDVLNTHDGGMEMLDSCKSEAHALQGKYANFAKDASQLLAASARNDMAAASVSLLHIAESIWPTLRFHNAGEKSVWMARTLRNPTPFIAQSYDALSLALGRVNAALDQAKICVLNTGRDRSSAVKYTVALSIREGDAAYCTAKEAFDQIDIPIDAATLKGHSILAVHSAPAIQPATQPAPHHRQCLPCSPAPSMLHLPVQAP